MLSMAAKNNLHLGQFDIKTAFLYGSLKEDIYMKQPKGFDDGTNRVCKLLKLEKFNMNEANSVSTPIETNWNESNIGNNDCNAPYREAVGNLMFLQTGPRTWDSYIQKQVVSKPSAMLTMQATKTQESRHQALYVSMRMRPLHGNVSDNNV
ncbi:uncharacterized protein LOC132915976 [Bombus pascuorum]|uniref:uncharacterized protein LOC132915976 n=1 Tax=Bombus pascuorum TaxID=65598 RepID=UPI00298DF4B8|nr:uncharacterized protein LOC132915976 [Bombus pascuorum]